MLRFIGIALMAVTITLAQDHKPAPTLAELEAAAQVSYMHADYEAAHQSLLTAWGLAQQLPPEDPARYDVLKRLANVRAAVSEFADADNFLQLAISWREQNLGPKDPKIPDDVLLSVAYARGLKDFDRALRIMNRVVRLHANANVDGGASPADAMKSISVADDFTRIAQIQTELKQPEAAVGSLNFALEIRTKLLGPLDPSLDYDLDRLGGLQVSLRTYDKAEETYRHALVIRETAYGRMSADLIATVDGLAYALFGQKKFDDAEAMYQRLLELWISSVGEETHPMVAIALDKIAVFYALQKKWDQAREATTRANGIRSYLLADGLSVEASQRIDEGKLTEAVPLYQRALQVLEIPNPIYDKQRATIEDMLKELNQVLKKPTAPARQPTKK
jgi:tetratricopeptide (TPR) repeat protein